MSVIAQESTRLNKAEAALCDASIIIDEIDWSGVPIRSGERDQTRLKIERARLLMLISSIQASISHVEAIEHQNALLERILGRMPIKVPGPF